MAARAKVLLYIQMQKINTSYVKHQKYGRIDKGIFEAVLQHLQKCDPISKIRQQIESFIAIPVADHRKAALVLPFRYLQEVLDNNVFCNAICNKRKLGISYTEI